MTRYPEVDTDVSGYIAEVRGDSFEIAPMRLPGVHAKFSDAQARARRAARALIESGETGLHGHVGFTGVRPDGFPQTGVPA